MLSSSKFGRYFTRALLDIYEGIIKFLFFDEISIKIWLFSCRMSSSQQLGCEFRQFRSLPFDQGDVA